MKKEKKLIDLTLSELVDQSLKKGLVPVFTFPDKDTIEQVESYEELHKKLYPEAAAKPEHIICAAIHYDDKLSYLHQPVNIKTGIVVCGRRHHNIIYNWNQLSLGKTKRTDTQGFLTSKDRFVDRKEGGKIAFDSGQILKETDCLFSEDLY